MAAVAVSQILISSTHPSDVTPILPATVERLRASLPEGSSHTVWSHDALVAFLEESFPRDVVLAFHALRPYAYKADLARYCLLARFGGWYVDIGVEVVAPFPDAAGADMIVFVDEGAQYNCTWPVATSFLFARRGHPVTRVAVDLVVRNCRERFYGNNPLCVTGPVTLGQAFALFGPQPAGTRYRVGRYGARAPGARREFLLDGSTLALSKDAPGGVLAVPGSNDYNAFWHAGDVFDETYAAALPPRVTTAR